MNEPGAMGNSELREVIKETLRTSVAAFLDDQAASDSALGRFATQRELEEHGITQDHIDAAKQQLAELMSSPDHAS